MRRWCSAAVIRKACTLSAAVALAVAVAAPVIVPSLRALAADSSSAQAQPKKGGRLIVAQADDYRQFDPVQIADNPSLFELLNFYQPLLRTTTDGADVEGGVAEKWESENGGTSWVFTIRNGIKFRDGSLVTAGDVKFSLDRLRASDSQWASVYEQLDSVQVIDDTHVRVNLKNAWAPILSALAMFPSCILPQKTFDVPNPNFDEPNGTGPFTIGSWDRKQQMVLKPNPNYWEPGKPYLDEIVVKFISDDNARILQFQGGQSDVILDLPLNQVGILAANPQVVSKAYQQQALMAIRFNHTIPPLDNVKVRQALNYASDKDAINKVVFFGLAEVQNSPIPKGTFWDPEIKPYPYDVAMAKQLMAEAGLSGGVQFQFNVPQGNLRANQLATVLQAQWKDIGVELTLNPLERSVYRQRELERNYGNMDISIWTNDMNDPTQVMRSTIASTPNFSHLTGYKNERVDSLIIQAETEQDRSKRAAMYSEIQRIVRDDAYKGFIVYWPEAAANQKAVQGFMIDGLSYHRYQDVWLDK